MIELQAVWTKGQLHLWGLVGAESSQTTHAPEVSSIREFVTHEELHALLGDHWDSLLISGAEDSGLSLRLPRDRHGTIDHPSKQQSSEHKADAPAIQLVSTEVPTLCFGPADALDVLNVLPSFSDGPVSVGASYRFWSRAAAVTLELLARQRFLPTLHDGGGDRVRGYWRALVNDASVADRVGNLIQGMPPVCRSFVSQPEPQAAALVEDFLRSTVDATVRRVLEADELAQPLREIPDDSWPLETRWLRSLVADDPAVYGSVDQLRRISKIIQDWVARVEPPAPGKPFRTCFQLHAPPRTVDAVKLDQAPWRLSIQVQSTLDPTIILAASAIHDLAPMDPTILGRPMFVSMAELRDELKMAARHFPPLGPCAEVDGPLECFFGVLEAYRFLRDASLVLEREGFRVELPKWWREERPKLRMRMDLRPVESAQSGPMGNLPLESVIAFDWRVAVGQEDLTLEEISALAAAKEPLVRVKGQWTEVRPNELRTALDFLQRHQGESTSLLDALRRFYLAEEQETGIPVSELRAGGWIERLLSASEVRETYQQLVQPNSFLGRLREYQLRGLAWLAFLDKHGLGACLADDMGLGKTIQMIALWLQEREVGTPPGPSLLVVPMSLVGNWQRELSRFAPKLKVMVHHGTERLAGRDFVDEVGRYDVVISTYGLTHRDFEHLSAVDWHRVVLDEAQNIKNPAAKQSAAVRHLRARRRVALTGTPVENRLSELWSILDFLNPGYLSSASEFRRRFAVPIERFHDDDRAHRLRSLIRPFVLRRKKEDPDILPDLPQKMETKVYCNLTKEQAALYEAVVADMLARVDQSDGIQRRGLILATLVKLKQICNHPAHFLGDGSALGQRSGKCERIAEMLDELVSEGHRALVFTQFREMGDLLVRLVSEMLKKPVLFLHGGTPQKNRDQMVQQFQDPASDAPVFLLSLKAGGLGLNLTAANHVFHFDRWWNPAVEDQATDRAHRIGQEKQVQVHKFICVGTLEERIDAIIEQKRNIAENIVGSGEDWLTELSTEGLRELLMLSRDAVSEE